MTLRRLPLTLMARTSLHVWLLLLIVNFGIYYAFRFNILAEECLTPAQVAQDTSRCLFIYSGSVYQMGSPGSGHMGHQCGGDVTTVMKASHVADVAKYLDPRRIASVCAEPPPPSLTPEPSLTPVPSNTPVPPSPTAIPDPGSPPPSATPTTNIIPGGSQTTVIPTRKPTVKAIPTETPLTVTMLPTQLTVVRVETLGLSPTTGIKQATPTKTLVKVSQPGVLGSLQGWWDKEEYVSKGWWVRVTAILGLMAMGVALGFGFHRLQLYRIMGRRKVMWLHYGAGAATAILVGLHIILVLIDKSGWGEMVKFKDVWLPSFRSRTAVSVTLGLLPVYILALVIITGIGFKRIAKKMSYKVWHLLHLSSLVMILLVIAHAWRLGTDSHKPWMMVVLGVMLIYVLGQINRAIVHLFIARRPVGGSQIDGKGLDETDAGQISKVYYVTPKNRGEDGGWWVTLSDGINRIWGFTTLSEVSRAWLRVEGYYREFDRVPMIVITKMIDEK